MAGFTAAGAGVMLAIAGTMALAGAGIVIGLGAAAAVARLMTALLFGISPFDVLSFGIVPFILAAAAALASYSAASRAAVINPVDALKAE